MRSLHSPLTARSVLLDPCARILPLMETAEDHNIFSVDRKKEGTGERRSTALLTSPSTPVKAWGRRRIPEAAASMDLVNSMPSPFALSSYQARASRMSKRASERNLRRTWISPGAVPGGETPRIWWHRARTGRPRDGAPVPRAGYRSARESQVLQKCYPRGPRRAESAQRP